MPQLYLIPSEQPNAFATGRDPKKSAVAVTEGLLAAPARASRCAASSPTRSAHIDNRDILVTTIAAMIGAAIAAIANILQFSLHLRRRRRRDDPLGFIGALVAIIVAPLAAMILQLAVSRQREYLADATAAQYLGEGEPLAEALGTLQRGVRGRADEGEPGDGGALHRQPAAHGTALAALFSTHPPMEERIRRLRELDAASGIHY